MGEIGDILGIPLLHVGLGVNLFAIVYMIVRHEMHVRSLMKRTYRIEQVIQLLDDAGMIESAQTALGKRKFVERQVRLFNQQSDMAN